MEILQAYGPTIALVLLGLFGIAKVVINAMAKRPIVDGWDDAKEVLDKLSPIANELKAWADPENDAVPPSPSNPAGIS
jgi:hypothetical protein